MSKANQKNFVLITFHQDGFTACVAARDVGPTGEADAGQLSTMEVGNKVVAYWQDDCKWFPATVRRFGPHKMTASSIEEKKWKKEFPSGGDDEEEEEEGEEGEEEDEEGEEEEEENPKGRNGKPAPSQATMKAATKAKPQAKKSPTKGAPKFGSEAAGILEQSMSLNTLSRRHHSRSRSHSRRSRSGSPPRGSKSRSRSRSPSRSRSRSPPRSHSSSAMLQKLQKQVKSLASELNNLKQAQAAEEMETMTKISPK